MKIDEGKLMAYLYGELSAEEKREVELHFQQHPDALKEFQDISFVRSALSKATDKEVIAPPIFMDDERVAVPPSGLPSGTHGVRGLWAGSIRYAVGIAAAFLIIMVGAKLLGVQMQYSDSQFTLSFGEIKKNELPAGISPQQVQQLIDASLARNNDYVQASLNESQSKWSETLKQSTAYNSQKFNEVSKHAAAATQEEIRQFMERMRSENNNAVQEYLRLSSNEQQQYIEGLLIDFSKYMQEQRNSDLNLVNTRLTSLEQENNQFREEAGQILTSLITNSTNTGVRRN
jgi:hypothetical protein